MAFKAEVAFPHATGVVLVLAVAFIYMVYKRTGYKALVYLMIGLLSVAIESFLDGYEASLLFNVAGGDWNAVPKTKLNFLLTIDAVRGFFIVIWAAMEVLFTAEVAGTEKPLYKRYIPAIIIVVGFAETIYMNFYSGITPLDKRILLSSAGRVLGLLVPAAIVTGFYLLLKVYKALQTRSILAWGLGFVIHGLTLPTYSFAKEQGAAFLGLWYTFGGVIPALLTAVGAYYLLKEAEAVEEEV